MLKKAPGSKSATEGSPRDEGPPKVRVPHPPKKIPALRKSTPKRRPDKLWGA